MFRELRDPTRYLLRSELRYGRFYRDRLSGKEVRVCRIRQSFSDDPPIVTVRIYVEGKGYEEHQVSDHQLEGYPPNESR